MNNSQAGTWESHPTGNGSILGGLVGGTLQESVPTILVPGIASPVRYLRPLASALYELGHETLVVDISKAGNRLIRPSTLSSYARLLMEAVDEQLGDQRLNIVGHSWGGVLAQELALQYPSRVKKLGLLATLPGGLPLFPMSPRTMLEMLQPDISWAHQDKVSGSLFGGELRKSKNPDLVKTLGLAHDISREAYLRQNFAVIAGVGLFHRIRQIKQDTLIIAGTDDPIIPYPNSLLLQKRIPRSRLQALEGAGHMFPTSLATETALILDSFLG